MSVWLSSAGPSNMGQESSALAQRSVGTSAAGGTRVGSIQGSHNSSYADDVTDKRQDELPSDRSRQQAHATAIKFPLPRRQQANTPDTRIRPRSPPPLASHASARFPSPGSARHRFVRENLDGRQMTDDRSSIHPRSSRSPIARFGSRNDLTHQQSPVPRRYSDNHASWAQNSGSPITPRERAGYPPEDANLDRTRDYHGLRNVPVGPRRSFTGTISVKKDHSTRSPCIFISLRYIPKLPNLKWHLNRLLKAHRPEEIIIDDFGWNLIFNDSPAGQETLRQCYEVYNKRMFFDEYELVMQCFPTGRMPRSQYHEDINSVNTLHGSSESRLPSRRSSNAALPNPVDSQERKFPSIEPTKSHQSSSATGSLNLNDQSTPASSLSTGLSQNLLRHSSEGPRTHEATPNRFNTSLLPLPSDRDETGSLASVVTRSDGSRVKRNKCHRCKGEPAPGSSTLVRCSTCSREYHRRCHQDPSIPADLSDGHDWSCARCVKKGRTAKHLQTNDGNASSPKLCMPSVETESSLGRLTDKDEQNCSQGHVRPACDNSVRPVARTPRSDSKSPQNEIDRSVAANTELKASIVDNDPVHSDADDLVARSFAAPVIQSRLNPRSQNPGKLKMTRTKLLPPAPVSLVQHTGGASASVQPGSSVAASPKTHAPSTQVKTAQSSEPIARNSVADLRALANERHQSAIKSGNRENSANEERDRHVTSINPHGFSGAPLPPQPQRRHDSISATPAITTRETDKEIPESPEEVRRADQTGGKATRDPRLMVKQSSILQEPVENPSDAESIMNEQPPVLKGPRPPSNIVRCSICQKKIPPGPSGKNKLCSACKKDKAAATATRIGVANATMLSPLTNIMPAHSPGAPVARMIAGPTKAAELEAPVNGGGGNADLDSLKQAAPIASDNAVQGSATPVRQTENNTSCSQQIPPQVRISGNYGTDMPIAECAHTDTRDRSRLPDHIPHFKQPASIDHTTPAQVTALKDTPSSSRLDFIKSVVGNSFERPKGSRLTLVAMALGSVASRRMQAKDVMDWIADTVPGYKKGEGNWASRISAQLSQGRLTDSGGYWREDEWQEGDGGKPKGRWYQLLPEREDEMWTWCPILGEPLSPSQRRHKSRVQTLTGPSALDPSQPRSASFPVSATISDSVNIYCGSVLLEEHGKRLNVRHVEAVESGAMDVDKPPADDTMEIDVPAADDTLEIGGTTADDTTALVQVQKRKHRPSTKPTGQSTPDKMQCSSEDDEPLSMQAKRTRRDTPSLGSTGPRATPQQPLHVDVNEQSNVGLGSTITGPTEGQRSTFDTTINATNNASSTTNARRAIPHLEALYIQDLGKLTRETSVQPSIISEDQVATSLYDEWPNFRQQASDEYDKLVEISKRPRKKKTFGKVSSHAHSQLHEPFSGTAIVAYNPSPEKRSRFTMPTLAEPYPWENPNIDLNRKDYASLEDFFDFPDNMIPIISEGQLAYRDGTRTDDGRLPRAREIFRPG